METKTRQPKHNKGRTPKNNVPKIWKTKKNYPHKTQNKNTQMSTKAKQTSTGGGGDINNTQKRSKTQASNTTQSSTLRKKQNTQPQDQ